MIYSVNTFPSSDNRAVTSMQRQSVTNVRAFCFDLTVQVVVEKFLDVLRVKSWFGGLHEITLDIPLTFVPHQPNLFPWLL